MPRQATPILANLSPCVVCFHSLQCARTNLFTKKVCTTYLGNFQWFKRRRKILLSFSVDHLRSRLFLYVHSRSQFAKLMNHRLHWEESSSPSPTSMILSHINAFLKFPSMSFAGRLSCLGQKTSGSGFLKFRNQRNSGFGVFRNFTNPRTSCSGFFLILGIKESSLFPKTSKNWWISWYNQQRYLISSGLSDPAPKSTPSKKSRSGISWMGWNCPQGGSLHGQ